MMRTTIHQNTPEVVPGFQAIYASCFSAEVDCPLLLDVHRGLLLHVRNVAETGWEALYPLSGQILYNVCTPVIIARSSIFTEDFVVGCDQVTEPFRAWYVDFGVSSVPNSRNFGPLADLAIWVL